MAPNVSFTKFYNVINGELLATGSPHYGINPANGEQLWPVPIASKQDVNEAVAAARTAFKTWRQKTIEERREMLRGFALALKPHIPALSELLTSETGKAKQFAAGETIIACNHAFDHFVSLSLPNSEVSTDDRDYRLRYVPLGVVAAILPWNFPISQVSLKSLPALLAGNCVIIKPSPFSPYTALKVVEIAQQVLPPGVLQVLAGDDNLGPWLVDHEGIDKISFTGSCATGKKVMANAARTLKRVTLELGGNDAAIVCDDIDIKDTAKKLVIGSLHNSGQVCATTKRIYAHEKVHSELVREMSAIANSLKFGDLNSDDTFMGPLQNKAQFNKVKDLYEDSKTYIHGKVQDLSASTPGFFIAPTIVDSPPESSRIMQEEQFGPILPVQSWTDEGDVIERANATPMGLGASVWSRNLAQATRIAESLEAGSVFINSPEMLTVRIPFGGHKESGIGVEGGSSALTSYTNLQVIHSMRT